MSNATRIGQSPLRALAVSVQDRKCDLVLTRCFFDLMALSPFAPMRRLDVDALFRRSIDPSSFILTADPFPSQIRKGGRFAPKPNVQRRLTPAAPPVWGHFFLFALQQGLDNYRIIFEVIE
jgi:hypothetical protein